MTNMRILGVLVWAGLSFVAADAQTSRMIAQPGAAILEPPPATSTGELVIELPKETNCTVAAAQRQPYRLDHCDRIL